MILTSKGDHLFSSFAISCALGNPSIKDIVDAKANNISSRIIEARLPSGIYLEKQFSPRYRKLSLGKVIYSLKC